MNDAIIIENELDKFLFCKLRMKFFDMNLLYFLRNVRNVISN